MAYNIMFSDLRRSKNATSSKCSKVLCAREENHRTSLSLKENPNENNPSTNVGEREGISPCSSEYMTLLEFPNAEARYDDCDTK